MTDSWVNCSCHRRHWGAYGAAGLLLLDGDGRVLLQQRAPASQHGNTWGIPGGAKAAGEPIRRARCEWAREASWIGRFRSRSS